MHYLREVGITEYIQLLEAEREHSAAKGAQYMHINICKL